MSKKKKYDEEDDLENFDITYFANIMGIKEDADEVDTTLQLNRKFYPTKDNDIDEASEIIDKFDKELNEIYETAPFFFFFYSAISFLKVSIWLSNASN